MSSTAPAKNPQVLQLPYFLEQKPATILFHIYTREVSIYGDVYFLDFFGLPFFRKKILLKILLKTKIFFIMKLKKNGEAKDLLLKDVIFLGNPSNFQLIPVLQKKSAMVVLAVYFYALTQPKIDYHLGKLPLLGLYDADSV